jgi:hypothetical protein
MYMYMYVNQNCAIVSYATQLTNNEVELKLADGMVFREHAGMPPNLLVRFKNL